MASSAINFEERLERRIGRDSRVRSVSVRFTKAEETELEAVAKAEGLTLREWCRKALLENAGSSKDEALLTEIIAGRMLLLELLRPLLLKAGVDNETISAIMAGVRRDKHKTTAAVKAQYLPGGEKE